MTAARRGSALGQAATCGDLGGGGQEMRATTAWRAVVAERALAAERERFASAPPHDGTLTQPLPQAHRYIGGSRAQTQR
jgi:hypothetical protein